MSPAQAAAVLRGDGQVGEWSSDDILEAQRVAVEALELLAWQAEEGLDVECEITAFWWHCGGCTGTSPLDVLRKAKAL